MSVARCCSLLAIALVCTPSSARAQLGEVQLGAVVSNAFGNSFGRGGGVVAGVAAGRLSYIGVRAVYLHGGTESAGSQLAPVEVTNKAQLITMDVGLMTPLGPYELVPGVSVGVMRFAQHAHDADSENKYEFVVAPGLALHAHAVGLVFIPEAQYYMSGRPDMAWPVSRHGFVASLRIVVPFEVGRIRH